MEILEQIRKKVQDDAAFSASLKEAKTPEEVLKVLLAAGFQVTMADVLKMARPEGVELSDEELEEASGGLGYNIGFNIYCCPKCGKCYDAISSVRKCDCGSSLVLVNDDDYAKFLKAFNLI